VSVIPLAESTASFPHFSTPRILFSDQLYTMKTLYAPRGITSIKISMCATRGMSTVRASAPHGARICVVSSTERLGARSQITSSNNNQLYTRSGMCHAAANHPPVGPLKQRGGPFHSAGGAPQGRLDGLLLLILAPIADQIPTRCNAPPSCSRSVAALAAQAGTRCGQRRPSSHERVLRWSSPFTWA